MAALRAADKATVVAIAEPSPAIRSAVLAAAPDAEAVASLEKLLQLQLDGLVIAANGLSAVQAKVALDQGLPVFCQLPVGRNAKEAANVLEAAERADRLFCADRRYRYTDALAQAHDVVESGELGEVYAAVIELHTADKRDVRPQLLDALTWIMGEQRIQVARNIGADIRIDFEGGAVAELSISPRLDVGPAGFVRAELYGTTGTICFESAADTHGDPALIDWVEKLANSPRFSPADVKGVVETAQIIQELKTPSPLLTKKAATA